MQHAVALVKCDFVRRWLPSFGAAWGPWLFPCLANMSETQDDDSKRWKWPRFTLREVLAVVFGLAVCFAVAARDAQEGVTIFWVVGSLILVWGYVCWKTVRLNPDFFAVWKRKKGVE